MTFPLQFHFGSGAINAHFIFEVLAYFVGFQYFLYLRKNIKDTISFEERIWIVVAGAAGALLGSRFVGYYSNPVSTHSFMELWIVWMSSKSILGGLLGGIMGVEIGKKIMRIKTYTGDLFVYPIIVGMMIGRLGCFSQGVFDGTHGNPSDLPWAMDLGDGILRHPAQLYEIIFLAVVWMTLNSIDQRLTQGSRFKLFIIAYLFYRFFIEWLKPVYFYSFGLSAVQVACVLGFLYYAKDIIYSRKLFKEESHA